MAMPINYRDRGDERCINCGLVVKIRKVPVAGLAEAERALLEEWLRPFNVPAMQDRFLCHECAGMVRADADAGVGGEGGAAERARRVGHVSVCATCGDSLLRRGAPGGPSTRAPRNVQRHSPAHKILEPYIYLYNEGSIKVCHACNVKVYREVKKIEEEEAKKNAPEVKHDEKLSLEAECENLVQKEENEVENIELEGYWKLAVGGEGRAVCAACGRGGAGGAARLSLRARRLLLLRRRLYLPARARACAAHAAPAAWPAAAPPERCLFTPPELADMLFLLKGMHPIDLAALAPPAEGGSAEEQSLQEYNCRAWLGVSPAELETRLQALPALAAREDGRLALAAHLARAHSAECPAVLASLAERPEAEIQAAIRLAAQHIQDSSNSNTQETQN